MTTADEAWTAAQREWADPANWRGSGPLAVYHAPRDPRILVRKREMQYGWTLNFAHRASWVWAIGVPLAAAGVVALLVLLG